MVCVLAPAEVDKRWVCGSLVYSLYHEWHACPCIVESFSVQAYARVSLPAVVHLLNLLTEWDCLLGSFGLDWI